MAKVELHSLFHVGPSIAYNERRRRPICNCRVGCRRHNWNVFNVEEESALSAQIVTCVALSDMLTATNLLGVFAPNGAGFGCKIVGSGSDLMLDMHGVPEPGPAPISALALIAMFVLSRGRGTRGRVPDVAAVSAVNVGPLAAFRSTT